MKVCRPSMVGKQGQRGYALLMVVFMCTALLIAAMMVAPNVLTEGRREKEKEMIWRGNQYVRGIKLHYRKLGRFPTSLDDLTKPKIGALRFMRQAYKDPMNAQDGSWRLIYVGPAGQLIGSLKPRPQNLLFGQAAGFGTPASALAAQGALTPVSALGQPGFGQQGQPGATGAPVSADQGTSSDSQIIPTDDPAPIIGGNIIGVGSKINQPSVIVYEKAKNYRLYEFIWDPSKDVVRFGQPGLQLGTSYTGAPGVPQPAQPQGQSPTNPQPNPQQPQSPQQQ